MDIKKVLKNILKLLEWLLFITLIIILFLVASPLLPTKNYISTHVVSTGSMEPAIKTGSIVFSTLQNQEINKGDIIVFTSPDNKEITVIHRVMDIEENEYTTKGDNNENKDSWVVFKDDIKGEVIFSLPYIGYVIDFMKSPIGFGISIGIPALILILTFIKKIKDGINEEVDKRTKEEILKEKISKQNTPPILTVLILISFTLLFSNIPKIYALFSSSVSITGITLAVGEIKESIPEVVINEVMWSGTSQSLDDQWIELYNTTSKEIDIGKWKIEYLRDIDKPAIMIPANNIIPPYGFFLISNYSNESSNSMLNIEVDMVNGSMYLLPQGNGNLILRDVDGNTIDEVILNSEGIWPAGIQDDTFNSMQRSDDGLSWYSCKNIDCNSSDFWKEENSINFGSPKSINIRN